MFFKQITSAFCVFALVSQHAVFAQGPLDRIGESARSAETLATANRAKLDEIQQLLQALLANQVKDARANQYVTPDGTVNTDQAKKDAAEIQPRADKSEKALKDRALDRALGPDLRQRMESCATNLKKNFEALKAKGDNDVAAIERAIASCSEDQVQQILNELKAQREKSLQAWQTCRDTLIATGKVKLDIPIDPTNLQRGATSQEMKDRITGLQSELDDLTGNAKNCRDKLGDIFDDLQNQENASAAMASMMNFAATACMSSGGNPYVCGALFLFAFLASLSSGGSGDGDGDGDSDGTGQKGDGKNEPGTGPRSQPVSKPGPGTGSEPGPGPSVAPTAIDTPCNGPNCKVVCKPGANKGLDCTLAGKSFRLDPSQLTKDGKQKVSRSDLMPEKAKAIAMLEGISADKSGYGIGFCEATSGGLPIRGFVVDDGTTYFTVGVFQIGGDLALNISPSGFPMKTTTLEDRCKVLRK